MALSLTGSGDRGILINGEPDCRVASLFAMTLYDHASLCVIAGSEACVTPPYTKKRKFPALESVARGIDTRKRGSNRG